ncbi:MAG: hypothetical protein VYD19_00100, partial [Myxococcota bacterium]|nr:hypothetical protein [Myxococcota bacterium]
FNMGVQIENLKYQIQVNYDNYQDITSFIIDHLVGRENGSVLRGREMARRSEEKLRELIEYGYRMLRAFVYQYNLPASINSSLEAELFKVVTLDDFRIFVDRLDRLARDYCGQAGVDCDSFGNIETYRFSFRERLGAFRMLRDRPEISAGEQFHNRITGPSDLKRMVLQGREAKVIRIPFNIDLATRTFGDNGPEWMLSPWECNHFIAPAILPGEMGNVAANFTISGYDGANQQTLQYEMVRQGIDHLRACNAEVTREEFGQLPTLEYPIRSYTIGYAPQSLFAQDDNPPTFYTRSGMLLGCINQEERNGDLLQEDGFPHAACWRRFARGRSLATPAGGMELLIPVEIDGARTQSAWILDERRDGRPVIEDITVFFRYHSRPLSD